MKKYRFSATLLDSFNYYLMNENKSIDDFLKTINREIVETEAMKRGKEFQKAINEPNTEHNFDIQLIHKIREEVAGSYKEEYLEKFIKINNTDILIYGYSDYIRYNKIFELKTTSNYIFPKYLNAYQWKVYLLASGLDNLRYIITDFKNIFYEDYIKISSLENDIKEISNELIYFIEENENLINFQKAKILLN